MNLKDIDFRIIGMIFLIAGICIFIHSKNDNILLSVCMAIIITGIVISLIGIVTMVQKEKIKEKQLENDIKTIIQPLISKYSKINKELIKTQTKEKDMEIYTTQRKRMNEEIEEQLTIPYLTNKEIKKIVISFNREQDSL